MDLVYLVCLANAVVSSKYHCLDLGNYYYIVSDKGIETLIVSNKLAIASVLL